jgi:hypothetical protein
VNAKDEAYVGELAESLHNGNISWVCDQLHGHTKREAVFLAATLVYILETRYARDLTKTLLDALERRR